eukprot:TRINITY_DN2708_c0_g1_i2.p1 TRINITY_DN2708_c0_g1~~TRINITY_DN2708_c0_g1_i2.p1  ORF type:complete len:250 (+),score=37.34 TRINITY_DN2708_c0_g1_i2:192-941(+)
MLKYQGDNLSSSVVFDEEILYMRYVFLESENRSCFYLEKVYFCDPENLLPDHKYFRIYFEVTLHKYRIPICSRVLPIWSDLTKRDVDMIFCPTGNSKVLLGSTGIAKTVFKAAGESSLMKYIEDTDPNFSTLVSPSFDLPCKNIFLIRGVYSHMHIKGPSQTIHNTYINILDTAREIKARTLALPLIGSGGVGIRASTCTEIAWNCILEYLDETKYKPDRIEIVCLNINHYYAAVLCVVGEYLDIGGWK